MARCIIAIRGTGSSSARLRSKVAAVQSEVYGSIALRRRMEFVAVTAALSWKTEQLGVPNC